ncbi:MAG TPA: heavy metal-associated domain-containing protein, partial [Streptosporangiaceae bacterium]|nr:heavy metal-associated domain-containing protein [Streptosporangiaceae bacterium]
TVITVSGMTCEHCVNAVKSEISALPGVREVDVVLSTGEVTITADQELDMVALKSAVAEAGYDLAR